MNVGDLICYRFTAKLVYTGILLGKKKPSEKFYSGVTQIPQFVIKILDLSGRIHYYDVWDLKDVEVLIPGAQG